MGMKGAGVEKVTPDDLAGVNPEGLATGMTGAGVETVTRSAIEGTLAEGFAGAGEDAGAAISFAAGVLPGGIAGMTGLAEAVGLAAGGVDQPAAACLSFSIAPADLLAAVVGRNEGDLAGADGFATGAFTGGAFFATGWTEAGLALAAGAFGAVAEIFLADFLRGGVLAIRAEKLPRWESG
jgi:hypothetical protein